MFCNHYKPLLLTYLKHQTIEGQSFNEASKAPIMAIVWFELLNSGLLAFGVNNSNYGKSVLEVSNALCQKQKQSLVQTLPISNQGLGFKMGLIRQLESIYTLGSLSRVADVKIRNEIAAIGTQFEKKEESDNSIVLTVFSLLMMGMAAGHVYVAATTLLAEISCLASLNQKILKSIPKWANQALKLAQDSAISLSDTLHHFLEDEKGVGPFINHALPALYEFFHIGEHGLKVFGPHAHAHKAHHHALFALSEESSKYYQAAKNDILPETLYMHLSDLLLQAAPGKVDGIGLLTKHFNEVYLPVTERLRSVDAFMLGSLWFLLLLEGLHVRLALVAMGEERPAQFSTINDLFVYLDELLWRYTPLYLHKHSLLMTNSGHAVSALDLLYPEKLKVRKQGDDAFISIVPLLMPKRPGHIPVNTTLCRHASAYEISAYKKLQSSNKTEEQAHGFTISEKNKVADTHNIYPSFTCVLDIETQLNSLNKSNRLQHLESQTREYETDAKQLLGALKVLLEENKLKKPKLVEKLTRTVNNLSLLKRILLNTNKQHLNILSYSIETLATWTPFQGIAAKGDIYVNIFIFLDNIEAMLFLLDAKWALGIKPISNYPSKNIAPLLLHQKALLLGESYPHIKSIDVEPVRQLKGDVNQSEQACQIATVKAPFFRHQSIVTDGNCLFNSIIQGLRATSIEGLIIPDSSDDFRRCLVTWYKNTPKDKSINEAGGNLEEAMIDAAQEALLVKNNYFSKHGVNPPSYFDNNELKTADDYIAYIENDKVWGATVDIDLISLKLNISITVCANKQSNSNLPVHPMEPNYVVLHKARGNVSLPEITLWYNGVDHYELLLPTDNVMQLQIKHSSSQLEIKPMLPNPSMNKKESKEIKLNEAKVQEAPKKNKKKRKKKKKKQPSMYIQSGVHTLFGKQQSSVINEDAKALAIELTPCNVGLK